MKKIVSFLITVVLILGLSGCGNNSSALKIVDNSGNNIEKSATEIIEEYKTNDAYFIKNYIGAEVNVEGEIEKIKNNMIYLSQGVATTYNSSIYDVSNYKAGDKIVLKGVISTISSEDIIIVDSYITGINVNNSNENYEWIEKMIGEYSVEYGGSTQYGSSLKIYEDYNKYTGERTIKADAYIGNGSIHLENATMDTSNTQKKIQFNKVVTTDSYYKQFSNVSFVELNAKNKTSGNIGGYIFTKK